MVNLNPRIFRPKSTAKQSQPVHFCLTRGGMGDFIGYLSAIMWVAYENPHVKGAVWTHPFFMPIPKALLKNFPEWHVGPLDELISDGVTPILMPRDMEVCPISPLGSNQVDLGFIYFCNLNPAPEGWQYYPQLPKEALVTPLVSEKYIVLTPCFTTKMRAMPPKAFNGIKKWAKASGYDVVLLGKQEMNVHYKGMLHDDYDFSGCINLINRTEILETASILGRASVVVGLDNGLLHLTAMTSAPIVFGYNVAAPWHRHPKRLNDKTVDVFVSERELSCSFCQSKMRYLFSKDFYKECMYKDLKCLDILSDPNIWIRAIDRALKL